MDIGKYITIKYYIRVIQYFANAHIVIAIFSNYSKLYFDIGNFLGAVY